MDDLEKTKKAALRLLAFRPRSENELKERLARKSLSAPSIDRVVADLKKDGGLDDERFAKLYALSRIQSRGLGKNRVRQELSRRGLSGAQVARAMQALDDVDEEALALELARRRLLSMKGLSKDVKRRRLYGVLLRRGFAGPTVFKVLGKLLGAEEGAE